jgi:FkbH-like protein
MTHQYCLGVAGTFTMEPLERHDVWAMPGGAEWRVSHVFAPYNQLAAVCRNPAAMFEGAAVDGLLLVWRIEDISELAMAEYGAGDADAGARLLDQVERFCSDVVALRERFTGTIIVAVPPLLRAAGFDRMSVGAPSPWLDLYDRAVSLVRKSLGQRADIRLLDLEAVIRQIGSQQAHDDRKWYLYRQPYSEAVYRSVSDQVRRIVASEKIAPKKCIVVDCDNTLWGGIVGEDGIGGIKIGDTFPGRAFTDFQRELLALKQRGIFLAVASKNNEADVAMVFERHDAMVLSRKDLSGFQVHWDRKSKSIEAIAKSLNIGVDAVVFIDDSPTEIAEVRHNLPAVSCMLVPEELSELPRMLRESQLFDTGITTREDLIRVASVQHERDREVLREQMSPDEYLQSLGLVVTVFEAEEMHLERITQLINKTNQFNLTTKRITLPEIKAVAASGERGLFALNVRDRYGDYGLTAVAIIDYHGKEAKFDTLLMSCRVLSRGVEEAFLSAISRFAASRGCTLLRGIYVPTSKNAIVKDLYARLGFNDLGEDQWSLEIGPNGVAAPAHIELDIRPAVKSAGAQNTKTAG